MKVVGGGEGLMVVEGGGSLSVNVALSGQWALESSRHYMWHLLLL